ncbi:sporulation protein YunB [Candidatus Epulonipiscioides gigas]|nr:sporulation protein YunB [Epulopiscium sp. SCG-C07WGA-EpuloA2]
MKNILFVKGGNIIFRRGYFFKIKRKKYLPPPTSGKVSIREVAKYRSNQQNTYRLQSFIGILIIFITVSILYIQLDLESWPSTMAMAKLAATSVATDAINDAIAQTLAINQNTVEDLLNYDYDDDGKLASWNVNTILINNLFSQITSKCSDSLNNIPPIEFEIPLGNLTGSRIFANLGPNLTIEILLNGTVTVDYASEWRESGINQTNHIVWLDVMATVQMVVPIYEETVNVHRRIVLVDKVMTGEVPETYVDVPDDAILDVY